MTTRAAPGQTDPAEVPAGLNVAEAAARLARDGRNELPAPEPPSRLRLIIGQMTHFFALLLWVAGALALVAGMPQIGIAIFIVVIVNGLFAFAQEYRAERAAERLRDLLPRRVTVLRSGERVDIDASELVVGDLVVLEAGDRISADLCAIEAHALLVDSSLLTGESVPNSLDEGDPLFAGTFVVEGEGLAVVTATGVGTRLAGIAALTTAAKRPRTPLAVELDRVVRIVAVIAITVGVLFFVISMLIGQPASDGFLFAIGVTVALVPEGLLPTVTLSLAMGAQAMAKRNALVRRLESVETLGSTTFICTDKTGTLTRNEMTVSQVWTAAGITALEGQGYGPEATVTGEAAAEVAAAAVLLAGARCSTASIESIEGVWLAHGDPMEAAIVAAADRIGLDLVADHMARPVGRRFPFDPRRRRASVVVDDELVVKGAPDAVLPRCSSDPSNSTALAEVDRLAALGLRVLAVAHRTLGATGTATGAAPGENDGLEGMDADEVERDLILLGLLAFEDPLRPHAADAVRACRQAGIRVAMITGDHPATARAIAIQAGLIDQDGLVLEGADLPTDEAMLGALLDREGVVIARVSPEDKLRVAGALQARGHVVAMTGDGVNDGPALRKADIGIAMGRSGTDVAREAADLVLLDDDFSTIVAAVAQGRATFSNIRRFLTYHLTDNVAELTPFVIWAISGGRFPLAIGVLQVLALDIGTDLLPALALGAEPANPKSLEQPPRKGHLLDAPILVRVFGVLGPTEAFVAMTSFVVALMTLGWRPGDDFPTGDALYPASGAAFAAIVLGQMANAFACRSTSRPPWRLDRPINRLLVWAVAIELVLLVVSLTFVPLADLLGQAWPPLAGGLVALSAVPALLAADATHKWVRRRRAEARRAGLDSTR